MKRILTILILTLVSVSSINAQNSNTKKADRLYDKFKFVKASQEYLKLVKDFPEDTYIIKRLADTYYNIFDTVNAEKWYEKLLNENDSEVIYRYSQMLIANKKYDEAYKWMSKFVELEPNDSRSIAFKKAPKYIDKIKNLGKNYEPLDIQHGFGNAFGVTIFNDRIYFLSTEEPGFLERKYSRNNDGYLDIYSKGIKSVEQKIGNTTYTIPEIKQDEERVLLDEFNTKFHEGIISFSNDGNIAYFTRESFFEKEYDESNENKIKYSQLYIYRAKKINDKWAEFESLSINDNNYSNKNARLDSSGKFLYFSSNRPGGFGQYDIYRIEIFDDGSVGAPENLGSKINTEGQEAFPYFSNNELHFSSDGHLGKGGLDIFYSEEIDGKWTTVKNKGDIVNTAVDDFAYVPYEDGFFVSQFNKNTNSDNTIFIIQTCDDILLETFVLDAKSKLPLNLASTTIKDEVGSIDVTKNTNSDGLSKYMLACDNGELQIIASKTGYESKIVPIKISDVDMSVKIELNPIEELIVDEKVILNPIYFDFDKFNITNKAAFELDKLVVIMKKYPEMIIKVESHTDSRGSSSYNKTLSEKRALTTVEYLISKGIDESRVSGKGMGEDSPKINCKNRCSEDDHSENRRSEFIIVSRN